MLDTSRTRFSALSGLLGSAATVELFFEHYWEQCPLLIKDARWPRDLLTSERIEDLISFRQHGTEVVLARTWFDRLAERSIYSSRRSTDASDICQAWYDGATIIITALHLRDARVALFIQQLEAVSPNPIGANPISRLRATRASRPTPTITTSSCFNCRAGNPGRSTISKTLHNARR